ncbi:hypothetical protein [Staphylococcus succinus]|uniref:hypothetical protein n=1 Tax=Staphylococcus succinus TaxID=61015 RepID=UPI001C05949F|nr:hypothetical protein [Staphylococcus succinus]MBU0437761.1 hypothetical protein [Staphylococcus succinus]
MEFKNFDTYITFYEMIKKGPYPNDLKEDDVYSCKVKKYNNSIKDKTILSSHDKEQGFTFTMRDAKREFIPNYKQTVRVQDYRFEAQLFNIYDIRFDKPQRGYITVVVGKHD